MNTRNKQHLLSQHDWLHVKGHGPEVSGQPEKDQGGHSHQTPAFFVFFFFAYFALHFLYILEKIPLSVNNNWKALYLALHSSFSVSHHTHGHYSCGMTLRL